MWPNQVTTGFTFISVSWGGRSLGCSLPPSKSLGSFTAWYTGRVPFWWSGAYVRAPAAIKNGNCGFIKHGYESWGSLLCLVVSGGGSKWNRSWLAGGILGEAVWKCCRCSSKDNFCSRMRIIQESVQQDGLDLERCCCYSVVWNYWHALVQWKYRLCGLFNISN